jgi:hypothetical protein
LRSSRPPWIFSSLRGSRLLRFAASAFATPELAFDHLFRVKLSLIKTVSFSGFQSFDLCEAPAIGFAAGLIWGPADAAKVLDVVDPEPKPLLRECRSCFNRMEVKLIKELIDRKTHGTLPLVGLQEVCVRSGPAGTFRDSHFVAFLGR